MLLWIVEMAGIKDMLRWEGIYLSFTFDAIVRLIFMGWFPSLLDKIKPCLEKNNPALWLKLLSFKYQMKALDKL